MYFPWNLGEVFWEVLNLDHSILIGNAVRWALGARPRVEVSGPGVLDIATREGSGRLSVHLVNLTNPMMMKGPLREIFPIGEQAVSIKMPEGRTSASVKLLVTGEPRPCRIVADRLEIRVPFIEALETVHITWHS